MSQARFNATLVSVSDTILENSNGTPFRVCAIKLDNNRIVSARTYEKNYQHGMEIGTKYLCTATPYADTNGVEQIDVVVSHLTNAPRATAADFAGLGLVFEEVATPATPAGVLTPETI